MAKVIERLMVTLVPVNFAKPACECSLGPYVEVVSRQFADTLLGEENNGKKDADNHRIDRHKIIGLYIKSFLEVSPFIYNRKIKVQQKDLNVLLNCVNEYFAISSMHTFRYFLF